MCSCLGKNASEAAVDKFLQIKNRTKPALNRLSHFSFRKPQNAILQLELNISHGGLVFGMKFLSAVIRLLS